MKHHNLFTLQRPYQFRHFKVMGIRRDVCAAGNVTADVVTVADVNDGCGGVFVFEKRCEGFAGDTGQSADVELGG